MPQLSEENRERLLSCAAVAAFHAFAGYLLITGLGFDVARAVSDPVKMFEVLAEPPPPLTQPAPPEPTDSQTAKPKDPEGAASPANLRDTPTPVVAPIPVIRLPVPPPIVVAKVAAEGNVAAAGAADVRGPGTGSGGIGNGLGSGTQGTGTGGGGGGGRAIRALQIAGSIRDSDDPRSLTEARTARVGLRFVVAPTGRVSECTVTRSSGHRGLDETTCRLIRQRFRYRPARNVYGEAIPDVIVGAHDWEVAPEPPPIDVEPTIPDDY